MIRSKSQVLGQPLHISQVPSAVDFLLVFFVSAQLLTIPKQSIEFARLPLLIGQRIWAIVFIA